jgi:nicotinamidase-related amidase
LLLFFKKEDLLPGLKENTMPVTTLDQNTALVIIDLQKGIVSLPGVQGVADIIARAAALAEAFRAHNLPVVLVNVAGGAPGRTEQAPRMGAFPDGFTELVPELSAHPTDLRITKHSWGAFQNTGLAEKLSALGITQIVLAGVSTSIGVESTARQAYESGFNVALAIDAMTDMRAECHTNSVERIFPRLGETGTTQDILDLLRARAA